MRTTFATEIVKNTTTKLCPGVAISDVLKVVISMENQAAMMWQ